MSYSAMCYCIAARWILNSIDNALINFTPAVQLHINASNGQLNVKLLQLAEKGKP